MQALDLPTSLSKTVSSGYQAVLSKFLERPVPLRNGVWTTTSAYQLNAIDLPKEMWADLLFQQKASGFYAFRATIVLRLQVNATRFQQGRLIMSFIPQGQITGTLPYARLKYLRQLTQLPNVQLDACCDTEAILEIPYVSPMAYYKLLDGQGNIGAAFLHVYSPLVTASTDLSVQYTIWASFKDIQLHTPTLDNTFWTQGPRYKKKSNARTRKSTTVDDVTDQETQALTIGSVSSVLTSVSSVAADFAKVPFLSSIAGTTSWVAGALAGIASHFGWSNPINIQPPTRVQPMASPFVNNCDVADMSLPMSLRADNKVEVLPGFGGVDLDEMNIRHIVGIPSFDSSLTWTTSNTVGTVIKDFSLGPQNFHQTDTEVLALSTVTFDVLSPMCLMSKMFQFWKGSIRITFKFVKTEFHSGRLLMAYFPCFAGLNPTIDEVSFCYREIIDIRMGNEFTIIMPFVSVTPFLAINENYGQLRVFVLNELKAPDQVSQTIQILAEVSMAEDAEFAVPRGYPVSNYIPSTLLSNFTVQMDAGAAGSPDDVCTISVPHGGVGPSSIDDIGIAGAQYAIGEQITSILQLLKRSTYPRFSNIPFLTSNWSVRPFSIGGASAVGGALTLVSSDFYGDYFSILATLFAYNRGGVRFHLTSNDSTSKFRSIIYSSSSTAAVLNPDSSGAFSSPYNGSLISVSLAGNNDILVQMPSYNRTHSRLNRLSYVNAVGTGSEPVDAYSSEQRLAFLDCTSSNIKMLGRQVADDFAFGFYLSTLPYFISNV